MNFDEYVKEGLRALSFVQTRFPGAIIAGGFLRDICLKVPPKDIDIFVPYETRTLGYRCPFAALQAEHMTGAAEYITQSEVDSIWNLPGFALPVQIIELRADLDVIDRAKGHDFGICQIWCKGVNQGTEWTEEFLKDYGDKTFTLVHCEDKTQWDRSMRRWERLKDKFPGWRLVVYPCHAAEYAF